MNPGQEKFLNFILERVKEEEKENVKLFMNANFEKQMAGTFGMEDIRETQRFFRDRIKLECREEVADVMKQFSENFTR